MLYKNTRITEDNMKVYQNRDGGVRHSLCIQLVFIEIYMSIGIQLTINWYSFSIYNKVWMFKMNTEELNTI